MNKLSYTFDELLPYLKPTENFEFDLCLLDDTEFSYHLGRIDAMDVDYDKMQELFKNRLLQYPIIQSLCTDTIVGEFVYTLDNVIIFSTYQTSRRGVTHLYIHSKEKYNEFLNIIRSCVPEKEYNVADYGMINNLVFVYDYPNCSLVPNEFTCFLDKYQIIRKITKIERNYQKFFGITVTYLVDNDYEITEKLEDAQCRIVGFKFKSSEFIVENIVDKHISNFIKDGKYLCNQFGICVKKILT